MIDVEDWAEIRRPHRAEEPAVELERDRPGRGVICAQLVAQLAHQPQRLILLRIRVPTRRRLPPAPSPWPWLHPRFQGESPPTNPGRFGQLLWTRGGLFAR